MQWKLSLAIVASAFALNCASALPKPVVAKEEPPPPPVLTIDQILAQCKAHNAICETTLVDGRTALIGHFANTSDLANQVAEVTREAGVPYCRQSNQSGLAARFYMHVFYNGSNYLDCQTGKISSWEKDPRPGPIPAKVQTIGAICEYVEKDSNRPFHCSLVNNNGMVTLLLKSVVPASDAVPYLDDIENNLGKPFCDAGLKLGMGALIEVQFPMNGTGFRYNCETKLDPKPFNLAPSARSTTAPAPQQQSGTTVL